MSLSCLLVMLGEACLSVVSSRRSCGEP